MRREQQDGADENEGRKHGQEVARPQRQRCTLPEGEVQGAACCMVGTSIEGRQRPIAGINEWQHFFNLPRK